MLIPTHKTCLTRQVETTKICNKFAKFQLCWVGAGLEFSEPASGKLNRNINFYLPNPTPTHPNLLYYFSSYCILYLSETIDKDHKSLYASLNRKNKNKKNYALFLRREDM